MTDFTRIPQDELDAMEAREEAATEGPREKYSDGEFACVVAPSIAHIARFGEGEEDRFIDPETQEYTGLVGDADASFVAHARTDQPRLRIAHEAALADNERLREGLQRMRLRHTLPTFREDIDALLDEEGEEG